MLAPEAVSDDPPKNPTDKIPMEMWHYIADFCDWKSRNALSRVNHKFVQLFSSTLYNLAAIEVLCRYDQANFPARYAGFESFMLGYNIYVKMDSQRNLFLNIQTSSSGTTSVTITFATYDAQFFKRTVTLHQMDDASVTRQILTQLMTLYRFDSVIFRPVSLVDSEFIDLAMLYRKRGLSKLSIESNQHGYKLADHFLPRELEISCTPDSEEFQLSKKVLQHLKHLQVLNSSRIFRISCFAESSVKTYIATFQHGVATSEHMDILERRIRRGLLPLELIVIRGLDFENGDFGELLVRKEVRNRKSGIVGMLVGWQKQILFATEEWRNSEVMEEKVSLALRDEDFSFEQYF